MPLFELFAYYFIYSAYLDNYLSYSGYWNYFTHFCAWLESVGSRVLYELDPKKPVLYVGPVESIFEKLQVVPVGSFGTVPHGMRA